ncbi:flagellar basal body rod protein FlgC [Pseudotabrizicola sediminis]|uniref:Flagellar basal body rod protein FlgB n=1 Tax=Pseudotabrizicola sediminis TaxID=2486418 RepID=A0ABY2KLB1_9RHOB|nr:flagellar basal body rod protein FlgC [Pseudotabrizicola sediminis]TGD41977.1 flagellar basal body rod protein FlgC [Pseudotabrizicola sediminis]TGD67382.1 flagellar basal body rod protein FlgC [Tabrizicola sp. WMC-M-20]
MSDLLNSLSLSASGMEAQARRLRHVSENIANSDTPGYHRKVVSFRSEMESGTVTVGPVRLDQSPLVKVYAPDHPLADTTGHYDGSNVDLVIEIADAREAQRSYEANLRLFDQARQMTQSLFDLIRR